MSFSRTAATFRPTTLCAETAAELRYSETAFIKQLREKEFRIRYFTPAAEVDLCGHATIASFKALLHAGIIHDNDTYQNHTLAGDPNIVIKDGFVLMDMAAPVKIGEITRKDALDELYQVMGSSYDEQLAKGLKLLPQMISTGLPDIMMPVVSLADLAALTPDMPALAALSDRYEGHRRPCVHPRQSGRDRRRPLPREKLAHRSTISMKKPQPAPPTAP